MGWVQLAVLLLDADPQGHSCSYSQLSGHLEAGWFREPQLGQSSLPLEVSFSVGQSRLLHVIAEEFPATREGEPPLSKHLSSLYLYYTYQYSIVQSKSSSQAQNHCQRGYTKKRRRYGKNDSLRTIIVTTYHICFLQRPMARIKGDGVCTPQGTMQVIIL